jgi:hypothetical protein
MRESWEKMQDLLLSILDALTDKRVSNDALVVVKVTSAGVDVPIYHGLKQAMQTWDVVRQDADARVWEGTASTAPALFFNLRASGAVNLTVRVC